MLPATYRERPERLDAKQDRLQSRTHLRPVGSRRTNLCRYNAPTRRSHVHMVIGLCIVSLISSVLSRKVVDAGRCQARAMSSEEDQLTQALSSVEDHSCA